MTPTQFNDAATKANALWTEFDNHRLDSRIAERSGDADQIADTKTKEIALTKEWHAAHVTAEEALKSALADAGFDAALVKRYVK